MKVSYFWMAFHTVHKPSQHNANPGLMDKIHDYATPGWQHQETYVKDKIII